MSFVFPPPEPACLHVVGTDDLFPVRRIFCIGRNYADHAREMGVEVERGRPFFFHKSPEALVPQRQGQHFVPVTYPPATDDLHHEVELVLALKAGGSDLSVEESEAAAYGCAVGLDLTRRDLQAFYKDKRWPWDMAKNFDDSAPIGLLRPLNGGGIPRTGGITLSVNGQQRQCGDLSQMLWPPAEIIAELSRLVRLLPGDVIFTGTPAGVGALRCDDRVSMYVEGVGALEVHIN